MNKMQKQILSLGKINGLIAEKQATDKKITQIYIAEQMGISEPTLSKKLNGFTPFKESATEGELTILGMILGVDISEFYKYVEV
jgi:transcriptional regulator with XRE-family HTH domain